MTVEKVGSRGKPLLDVVKKSEEKLKNFYCKKVSLIPASRNHHQVSRIGKFWISVNPGGPQRLTPRIGLEVISLFGLV